VCQFCHATDSKLTRIQEEIALPPVVKKPNPQNEKNKATLEELEAEIKLYVRGIAERDKVIYN
jgi:hypothetical protein